jgi:hypothetical protein
MRVAFTYKKIEFFLTQVDGSIYVVKLLVLDVPSIFLDCYIVGKGQGDWKFE